MSNDRQVRAVRVDLAWAAQIAADLKDGVARFGWSYAEPTADLRMLAARIEAGGAAALNDAEAHCWQPYLLDMKPGDWLVYVNVPSYGRCTLAQVSGGYHWRHPRDRDFNHQLAVDASTVQEFDRNAAYVHPYLARRLKLQGRTWRIDADSEFDALREALEQGTDERPITQDDRLQLFRKTARPEFENLARAIHRTHPNYGLEHLLEQVFLAVPHVVRVERRGGAHDHGADLIVVSEHPVGLLGEVRQTTTVVQAKSYEGTLASTRCIDDVARALARYGADAGLVATTAIEIAPEVRAAAEQLAAESGKSVDVLAGADLAAFVVRWGW